MNCTDQPAWLRDEQLRWAWLSWEPLMMYRRVGGEFETVESSSLWAEDWFRRLHSEEYVKKLADAGYNCVTTHFHKGFGMVAEAEEMEMTRRLIEICHRYGIRVFTYVHSMSIMPETLYAEVPEADEWVMRDENNLIRTYGEQYWRHMACLSNDEYVAYIKQVSEKALLWAKADGIHLDNTGVMPCQCAACQRKFRAYLQRRFPDGDQERFGIPSLERVQVAVTGNPRDPVYQESTRFRCEILTDFLRDMRDFTRALNPKAALSANITTGSPLNFYAEYGVDYSNGPRMTDIILAEDGDFPIVEDDILITQIRYYKLGQTTGAIVIPSNWLLEKEAETCVVRRPRSVEEIKLDMAEAAAYGRRGVGTTWAARATESGRSTFWERPDVYAAVRQYNTFFKEHESLYLGAKSLANVATYRNAASLAFNYDNVYASIVGYEQAMIQNQIPFEILFSEDLARLDEFDVLVLPNILCMANDEIERIRAFVQSGKGLIATGETSLYDENYRQRRDYGLADLFGISSVRHGDATQVCRNGRVLFTPGTPEKVDCNRFNYQTRAPLPERQAELLAWIREVSPGELPLEVTATPFVTTEVCRVGEFVVVHLINHKNMEPVTGVEVCLCAGISAGPKAELLSVDTGERMRLGVARDSAGCVVACMPKLDTYSLILFQSERA